MNLYFDFPCKYRMQESTIYRRWLLSLFGECSSKHIPKHKQRLLSCMAEPCRAHMLLQDQRQPPSRAVFTASWFPAGIPRSQPWGWLTLLQAGEAKVIRIMVRHNYDFLNEKKIKRWRGRNVLPAKRDSCFLLSICILLISCGHN